MKSYVVREKHIENNEQLKKWTGVADEGQHRQQKKQ